jgi:hypothetical protein
MAVQPLTHNCVMSRPSRSTTEATCSSGMGIASERYLRMGRYARFLQVLISVAPAAL